MKRLLTLALIIFAVIFTKAQAQAAVVDLRTLSSSGSINGAIFEQMDVTRAGSGNLDPFVRLSDGGGNIINGYNTSYRPGIYYTNVNTSITFTHDLQLSALQNNILTLGGISYYEFLLDINQKNQNTPDKDIDKDGDIDINDIDPDKLLSLDQLKIYLSSTGNQNVAIGTSPLITPIYNLGANEVWLNAGLSTGSGAGDMRALIPTSIFGTDYDKYVYFYSEFGGTSSIGNGVARPNNDGFEEWGERTDSPVVPEPTTISLLGLGLLGLFGLKKRGGVR